MSRTSIRVTTVHTFTTGAYTSVFASVPAEPDAGIRSGSWELVSLTDAKGRELDEELLAADLTARGEEFSPEALVDLLWQEAESTGEATRAAA